MKVGNILIYRDTQFGHHFYFEVLGIYLGGENEASLIELRSLGENPGYAGGNRQPRIFVPECLTRNLEVRKSLADLVL